ncbi:MAG: histidine phosphatase family protein [Gaiellaceae bacterium]
MEAGNVAQADILAHALAGHRLAAVYTSPLERAVETAQRIAAAPIVVGDVREIELGAVAGLQFEEYPEDLQAALLTSPGSVAFPGGESYEQLRVRVVAALEQIVERHPDESVAVVSHAGAIRAALATWLGVAPDASFRLDQSFAALNVIDWTDGVPFVRLVNGATMPAALGAVL